MKNSTHDPFAITVFLECQGWGEVFKIFFPASLSKKPGFYAARLGWISGQERSICFSASGTKWIFFLTKELLESLLAGSQNKNGRNCENFLFLSSQNLSNYPIGANKIAFVP